MSGQCRCVRFSGTVQGVGFRYTTCRIAGGYDVTGYVRNLPDGAVEVLVEGTSAEIDAFLAELNHQMRGYIRHAEETTIPATGRFHDFGVRY